MARRNIHANPVFFTLGNVHKQVCQYPMVLTYLVIRLHVAAERYQIVVARMCMHPIP